MDKFGLLILLPLLIVADNGVRLHLKLHSFRNETYHRILLAQLQSAGATDQRVFLDVTLAEDSNETLKVVTMTAQTAVADSRVQSSAESTPPKQRASLPGYSPLDGAPGLYKLHRRALTWLESRAACKAEGTHLFVPDTEKEAAAAAGLLARTEPVPERTDSTVYMHIGISDQASEGDYVTETGMKLSSLAYRKWDSGQPTGGRDSNGIVMDIYGYIYDILNTSKHVFMCEAPVDL